MNIVIVIDGTNRQHLDILQRLTFNIVRLFGRETYVSFVVFGGTVDPTFAVWKTYVGLGPLQLACSSLRFVTYRLYDPTSFTMVNRPFSSTQEPGSSDIFLQFYTRSSIEWR